MEIVASISIVKFWSKLSTYNEDPQHLYISCSVHYRLKPYVKNLKKMSLGKRSFSSEGHG
jgi:hypothetical protein